MIYKKSEVELIMAKANKHKNCKHALKNMRKFVEVKESCPHKFKMGKYFVVLKNDCNGCSFFVPKLSEQQKTGYVKKGMKNPLVAEYAWHYFLQKVWDEIKEGEKIKAKTKYYEIINGTVKGKYGSFLLVATKNYKVCINIGELFCGDVKIVD